MSNVPTLPSQGPNFHISWPIALWRKDCSAPKTSFLLPFPWFTDEGRGQGSHWFPLEFHVYLPVIDPSCNWLQGLEKLWNNKRGENPAKWKRKFLILILNSDLKHHFKPRLKVWNYSWPQCQQWSWFWFLPWVSI